jgi:hypothetical protein
MTTALSSRTATLGNATARLLRDSLVSVDPQRLMCPACCDENCSSPRSCPVSLDVRRHSRGRQELPDGKHASCGGPFERSLGRHTHAARMLPMSSTPRASPNYSLADTRPDRLRNRLRSIRQKPPGKTSVSFRKPALAGIPRLHFALPRCGRLSLIPELPILSCSPRCLRHGPNEPTQTGCSLGHPHLGAFLPEHESY